VATAKHFPDVPVKESTLRGWCSRFEGLYQKFLAEVRSPTDAMSLAKQSYLEPPTCGAPLKLGKIQHRTLLEGIIQSRCH
jgi:hypothetical protein